jgi:hypothetical protein
VLGILDNRTAKTARVLHARATEAAERYLGLSSEDLERRVAADFPASRYWKLGDTVAFHYEELFDFSFMIFRPDNDTLSIQAGGPFSGFMLQHTGGRLWISLNKPLRGHFGAKAKPLAKCLEDKFGIKDPRAIIEKFGRRFR